MTKTHGPFPVAIAEVSQHIPPIADIVQYCANFRFVPCVDGSELARDIFTFAELVGAAMCSACLSGSHDRWP